MLTPVLVVLAFAGAFLSGLVGVGGAMVNFPLLLYVPPMLGLGTLDIKTVAGITVVHVFAASLAGLVGHRADIDRRLFLALCPSMVAASFAGAVASAFLAPIVLEVVFALMATLAATTMFVFRRRIAPDVNRRVAFRAPAAIASGATVGFGAGLVGAGGAFFLIPVMLYGLRIPIRVAVGTSLAIVAAAGAAGVIGKGATNQVDWSLAAALVIGALPGAWLGAWVSRRTASDRLAVVLAIAIAFVALSMCLDNRRAVGPSLLSGARDGRRAGGRRRVT